MLQLSQSLAAWQTDRFDDTFKGELAGLDIVQLPLQQALTQGSYASKLGIKVMINTVSETPDALQVRAGIFYSGILPGCACSDDVAPESSYPEFCDVLVVIDKASAEARVELLAD